jgi:hypothetical protein
MGEDIMEFKAYRKECRKEKLTWRSAQGNSPALTVRTAGLIPRTTIMTAVPGRWKVMQESNSCNCETCSNRVINANDDWFCTVTNDLISFIEIDFSKMYGCLSHPQARECLMDPVLKELKRQETNYTNKMLDQISRGNIHLEDEFGGISKGFSRAITLIKDGVKKQ